jgi:hypothetical protein
MKPKPLTKHQRYRHSVRARAIEALGGKCERCGFDDERALRLCHRVPLQRRRQGLSKKDLSSTESHLAVGVHGLKTPLIYQTEPKTSAKSG